MKKKMQNRKTQRQNRNRHEKNMKFWKTISFKILKTINKTTHLTSIDIFLKR